MEILRALARSAAILSKLVAEIQWIDAQWNTGMMEEWNIEQARAALA
jgi:hypothetical protein